MNRNIGELIKQRRTENKMTLEDISEATELSIGYLSQLERRLASIAHDMLKKVTRTLGTEMMYFMEQSRTKEKVVLYSYEREILHIEGSPAIEYAITNMADHGEMLSKLVETLPQEEMEESLPYPHEGGESVYTLKGISTLQTEDDVCDLYPGDYAHYKSIRTHDWSNRTNKVIKPTTINTLNLFQEAGEKL